MSTTPDPDLQVFSYNDLTSLGYGSRPTIWRKVRAGQFPQPFYIGDRPYWSREQLRELRANKGRAA